MCHILLQSCKLLLICNCILLQCCKGCLVLLLQLSLLQDLLLKLLVELLQLLKLCKLLRMLLKSGLQLRLLCSLSINLSRWFSLGSFTWWDVGQASASWNRIGHDMLREKVRGTRDGHVGEVLDDWLWWRTRLIRQLEGEGWHSTKTKGTTVNSMTRVSRLLTTITTFSLSRKQELGLSFLLQFLFNTLNKGIFNI